MVQKANDEQSVHTICMDASTTDIKEKAWEFLRQWGLDF